MKREIKFRAWHLTKSIMAEVEWLRWDGTIHVNYKVGESKDGFFFGGNNVGADWQRDDYELMQFTGLKDKNGKEIYESDILKLQYPLNYGYGGIHNKEIIVTISFESGCFWFTGEGYTDCNWHFYNEYEVIGNIYENPELLK